MKRGESVKRGGGGRNVKIFLTGYSRICKYNLLHIRALRKNII
jgi:hypothetical protein